MNFLATAGLMKRSADDANWEAEQRDFARAEQKRSSQLNDIRTQLAQNELEDYSRRRSTEAAVREEASKGFGLTPVEGQRSGDWSDRGTVSYTGRTQRNMWEAMANAAQAKGDFVQAQQLREQGRVAEQGGVRDFVSAYVFNGARGPQLGELWNQSHERDQWIDPKSVKDDGQGNITFNKLDGTPGKPVNMGQLAMMFHLLQPDEWDVKDNVIYKKKTFGGQPQMLAIGPKLPMGKDRYMMRKEGDREIPFDTLTGSAVGGFDAERDNDFYKKHLPEINAISEAIGSKAPIDPVSQKPSWTDDLRQRNELAQRLYRASLEGNRPMSPQQAANLALSGTVRQNAQGQYVLVAKNSMGQNEEHPLSMGEVGSTTPQAPLPSKPIPPQAQTDAQQVGGTPQWVRDDKGNDRLVIIKDGKPIGEWKAGPAAPPAVAPPPVKAPPTNEELSKELETLRAYIPSAMPAGTKERIQEIEGELQRRGVAPSQAMESVRATRQQAETRAHHITVMQQLRSEASRRGYIKNNPEVSKLFSAAELERLAKGQYGAVSREGNMGKANGGRIGLTRRGYADGGAIVTPKIDEARFQEWYRGHAQRLGLNPNPDDPNHFYDYRAAFAAGAVPDEAGHWPSKYKMEGHPRMVLDGINTKTGQPVGGRGMADGGNVSRGAPSGAEMRNWPKKPLRSGTGTVRGASVRDWGGGLQPRVVVVERVVAVPAATSSRDVASPDAPIVRAEERLPVEQVGLVGPDGSQRAVQGDWRVSIPERLSEASTAIASGSAEPAAYPREPYAAIQIGDDRPQLLTGIRPQPPGSEEDLMALSRDRQDKMLNSMGSARGYARGGLVRRRC